MRRRIALVTPMLPLAHDPTRGRYIYETARAAAEFADVRVFFQWLKYPNIAGLRSRSYLYGEVPADYRLEGLDVEAFPYPGIPGLSRRFNGTIASHVLTPRLRAFAPHAIVGYWIYPDAYAALRAARRIGVPCVVGALGSDIHVRSGFNATMTRKTLRAADAVIVVSDAMRRTAIESFGASPSKVHTVINGFNADVFRPQSQSLVRERLGIPQDVSLVIYVGRFVEAKGMRELVTAFSRLAQGDPRVRLALVGEGVMREELHALLDAMALRERAYLPGGLEPMQVADWIAASDVLTLPSWSEGYPNVLVEAIACGRPVVSTDVGGVREIVSAVNGLLTPPRDAAALTDALARALDRQWDREAIAASLRRSWADVARETLDVCERLIA